MGRSLARAAKVPGLGAEPLIRLCVLLCCAVQSALLWGRGKSPRLSLCSVLTPMGCWDSPSQASLCASVSLTWCCGQAEVSELGMGQGRVRRSLGLFLVTLGAPGHNIPALCHPLPAQRGPCSPWGRIVTLGTRLGTRLGTALSCTPRTPATPEERFSWLLIELHCHRKPRSRSSLEPPVSH